MAADVATMLVAAFDGCFNASADSDAFSRFSFRRHASERGCEMNIGKPHC
jgi:hypothetical protein